MPHDEILRHLKESDLSDTEASLAIVKEYRTGTTSHYQIKYVQTDDPLRMRLREIVTSKILAANAVEDYTFDCPEPEGDQVRSIDSDETNFDLIHEKLSDLNPAVDLIEDEDELVRAKAYLIVLRDEDGIRVVGFKTLPENWKLKREKGLIPLLFKNNRFENLEDDRIFSISNALDLIAFEDTIFVLSKRDFEKGLNFRDGMIASAGELYDEARALNIFQNIDILIDRVGSNIRYLRKIAIIKNLGHFRDPEFMAKMREVVGEKGWAIEFDGEQIIVSEETLDDILTILQNKRLHSEITDNDFDVEHAKPLVA